MKQLLLLIFITSLNPLYGQIEAFADEEVHRKLVQGPTIGYVQPHFDVVDSDYQMFNNPSFEFGYIVSRRVYEGLRLSFGISFSAIGFDSQQYSIHVGGSPGGLPGTTLKCQNRHRLYELKLPIRLEYLDTRKLSFYLAGGGEISPISNLVSTYTTNNSEPHDWYSQRGPIFGGEIRMGTFIPINNKQGLIMSLSTAMKANKMSVEKVYYSSTSNTRDITAIMFKLNLTYIFTTS